MNTEFLRHAMSPEAAAELRKLWGARIAKARTRRSLTRADLAKLVRVSTTSVGMWERGETSPRPLLQAAIAEALEVPHAELFPLVPPKKRRRSVKG